MTLDHHLKTMGFEQTSSDPCLYVSSKGELFFIAVYVDDIILAGESIERMNEVKSALSAQFDVKDLGDLHYFLGVKVKHDHEGSIWIGQPTYTTNILEKFGMKTSGSTC